MVDRQSTNKLSPVNCSVLQTKTQPVCFTYNPISAWHILTTCIFLLWRTCEVLFVVKDSIRTLSHVNGQHHSAPEGLRGQQLAVPPGGNHVLTVMAAKPRLFFSDFPKALSFFMMLWDLPKPILVHIQCVIYPWQHVFSVAMWPNSPGKWAKLAIETMRNSHCILMRRGLIRIKSGQLFSYQETDQGILTANRITILNMVQYWN